MATATQVPGLELPHQDRFYSPDYPGAATIMQRAWVNDTSADPKGVSPIKQDKEYYVSRMKPVFTDTNGQTIYAETTPVLTLGKNLVSPAQDADHGPPELQETLPIKSSVEALIIKEAVPAP